MDKIIFLVLGTLLLSQITLSVLVVYRHRRWLWVALPLAAMPYVWWVAAFVAYARSYRPH